jgi:acyl-CoA thioesterase
MDRKIMAAITEAVAREPFARALELSLITLENGHSVVEMVYDPERMNNIYQRAHGGALYALIDEAFETASQTEGTIAVALNVNVTYITSPVPGSRLQAEAIRISQTRRTAGYDIKVVDENGQVIATCQALAYRTGKPIPFL